MRVEQDGGGSFSCRVMQEGEERGSWLGGGATGNFPRLGMGSVAANSGLTTLLSFQLTKMRGWPTLST